MSGPPTVNRAGEEGANGTLACGASGAEQAPRPQGERQVKIVWRAKPDTGESHELARFWMERGRLRSEYKSTVFQEDIEHHGVVTAAGVHTPDDGAAFLDALSIAFSQSTFVEVETVILHSGEDGATQGETGGAR